MTMEEIKALTGEQARLLYKKYSDDVWCAGWMGANYDELPWDGSHGFMDWLKSYSAPPAVFHRTAYESRFVNSWEVWRKTAEEKKDPKDMGISHNAAPAPYKVTYWTGMHDDAPPLVRAILIAGGYEDGGPLPDGWPEDCLKSTFDGALPLGHGWSIASKVEHFPKTKSKCIIVVQKISKGKHAVYEIDEHPYSPGGACIQSFVSMDRPSLAAFCKDFGIKAKIEKDAVAKQTI